MRTVLAGAEGGEARVVGFPEPSAPGQGQRREAKRRAEQRERVASHRQTVTVAETVTHRQTETVMHRQTVTATHRQTQTVTHRQTETVTHTARSSVAIVRLILA